MIDDDKINIFIMIGSFLLIISIFLPWIKYIDVFSNYSTDLNALNLLTGTFGIFIPWSNWIDTFGINGYHFPMILPMISGVIGILFGYFRLLQKFEYIQEKNHHEILYWLCTLSFGTFIYIYITSIVISQYLWGLNVVIYLNGSGILLNLIGSIIILICGLILKKQII